MSRIVVALGGNALQKSSKDVSAKAQLKNCKNTAKAIVNLIENNNEVIVVHGNGPQVGQIVSTYEGMNAVDKSNLVMPFPECGAMSQGYIGYHLQQSIRQELKKRDINKQVASIVTQVVVDKNDPAFNNPTKPVGSFFNEDEAKKIIDEKGYIMKEDSGRGWRRVVPSPKPKSVVEEDIVRTLINDGHIVITAGGGGVPVIEKENGDIEGVSAVIDKDFAAEKIAEIMDADKLLILTAVEKVAINYNQPNREDLSFMTIKEAEKYIKEGHFAPGSMLPKVKAAVKFADSLNGRKTIITALDKVEEALMGKTGTVISK
ncbi:carbamate kinase [Clostridium oceanicum]|uniref:Carbamate kinase n=1 Tax=Clostridium oceanicum TaxID=1543 RepID=A0ABP3UUZ7_9CLOT